MTGRRSYDDPCGVARGLDVLGERWALLVVRELLFGPKRFTQLRDGLHGASQNVLSQRLRELQEAGVVRRRKLGPPTGTWAYELTERGRDLEPVLLQLGRWGSRVPMTSESELGVDALVLALKTTFDPDAAGGLRARYELRLGADRFDARVADGRLDLVRGAADRPDAAIEADAATLRSVVFGGRHLDDALGSGDLRIEGDRRAATRFVGLFPRPMPVPAGAE
ncbi:DNA-binding HxlR family transcriptional regulator [Streptosporangium album]|uniref:DNA-binding HxlR family transcriptional regulator n=1 Tax=Streptosporangium album TaxID=47479 RepID=A0A7W7RWK4_9ACTN|nr:winged helix-turn-helix transcriptional regulator [Streptosporangium album]MBB4939546.1 DNA-binding HxlR family transcriptional regulator [Streptosporangium album]